MWITPPRPLFTGDGSSPSSRLEDHPPAPHHPLTPPRISLAHPPTPRSPRDTAPTGTGTTSAGKKENGSSSIWELLDNQEHIYHHRPKVILKLTDTHTRVSFGPWYRWMADGLAAALTCLGAIKARRDRVPPRHSGLRRKDLTAEGGRVGRVGGRRKREEQWPILPLGGANSKINFERGRRGKWRHPAKRRAQRQPSVQEHQNASNLAWFLSFLFFVLVKA